VAERCRLPRPLVRKVEGSNLVFRAGDGPWLKICPPYWPDAFDAEVRATAAVQGRLPARVPDILETGALEDWRFLVTAHVPGVQIQSVLPALSDADLDRIADELGAFMAAFHAAPSVGFERAFGPWPVYLDNALTNARAVHLGRGNSPEVADRIAAFLSPYDNALRALGPPVLIHADLTDEHVMLERAGGRWRLAGVLDLADAMTAPAALDLIAPFVGLFRGRAAPQRRLAAAAGVAPLSPEQVMAVALQHRFMHFHDWFASELAGGMVDVGEIARAIFPGGQGTRHQPAIVRS